MSHTKEKHDQYYEMAHAPINHIIPKLAAPTIVSMLISSIYNMADTFFVSQLGTSASGAVGVIFSAMAIIQALAVAGCFTRRKVECSGNSRDLVFCHHIQVVIDQ